MNLWIWVLIACLLSFVTKLLGYLVPSKLMKNRRMSSVAGALTIGLLAALTVVNTVASDQTVVFDARLGALVAAAVALVLRAPFLVVVIVGAVAAALLRLAGWA